MNKSLTIAIDGPSASGKGTLSKKLAEYFKLPYLNTGALYRLIALRVINRKIDTNNFSKEISHLVKDINESDLDCEELFSEKVGAVASIIAKKSDLRSALFSFQKDFIQNGKDKKGGAVLDGRDTTTVICPDADYKFFVTANVEVRAKRRFDQLIKKGDEVSYEEILAQLKKRDDNDLNRPESPLTIANEAIIINNEKLSIEEGFQKILHIIED